MPDDDWKPALVFIAGSLVYVAIVNAIGLKYGKPGGKWDKSTKFPYWDNWSYTHLAWGAIAGLMGITPQAFLAINLGEEFVFEPALAYGKSKGLDWIVFSSVPDPFPHKVADAIYSQAGHTMAYTIRKAGRS